MLVRHAGVDQPEGDCAEHDAHAHHQGRGELAVALARDVEAGQDQREGRRGEHHAGREAEHDVLPPGRDPPCGEHRQGADRGAQTGQQAGEKTERDQGTALQAQDYDETA